ncbi:MAG: hypothetical protein JWQ71_4203 [Pedosphaera sp.]|nr:hypothetical protein [Pedosphaera sp.]
MKPSFSALFVTILFSAFAINGTAEVVSDPLPNPLVMRHGEPITSKQQWFHDRRPELKSMFQFFMYGTMPSSPHQPKFVVERVNKNFFGGKATKKEVTISFSSDTNAPQITLLLITPNHHPKNTKTHTGKSRGFPVFLGLNFYGNDALLTDTTIASPNGWVPKNRPGNANHAANEKGRGTQVDTWAIEQTIDRGYAFASIYCGDVQPDDANAMTGLRAWLKNNDTGAIAAWAWGASRAIDYLVTDKNIDPKRIAVVGHSRLGKAALVAGAFDERIALTIPLQAGTGGSAPSRGTVGESVKTINTNFPHWFNDQFKKYNDMPEKLPIDQNLLVALVAPRAVLFAAATEDQWANPEGQFEVLRAADPVYRFLGAGGLDAKNLPEVNHLVDSRLGYYLRPGKHSMTKGDWKIFLDYADKQMP